ncbi:hypothetical protein BKA70DRAFT_1451531 [Coprinopsis sp. MPI-PUGE-AT-0042]|nr:hypothetical protein BKA70DRAFT_1451531 [Coprinopsis sp. MPI-PUGE-AT-0042]
MDAYLDNFIQHRGIMRHVTEDAFFSNLDIMTVLATVLFFSEENPSLSAFRLLTHATAEAGLPYVFCDIDFTYSTGGHLGGGGDHAMVARGQRYLDFVASDSSIPYYARSLRLAVRGSSITPQDARAIWMTSSTLRKVYSILSSNTSMSTMMVEGGELQGALSGIRLNVVSRILAHNIRHLVLRNIDDIPQDFISYFILETLDLCRVAMDTGVVSQARSAAQVASLTYTIAPLPSDPGSLERTPDPLIAAIDLRSLRRVATPTVFGRDAALFLSVPQMPNLSSLDIDVTGLRGSLYNTVFSNARLRSFAGGGAWTLGAAIPHCYLPGLREVTLRSFADTGYSGPVDAPLGRVADVLNLFTSSCNLDLEIRCLFLAERTPQFAWLELDAAVCGLSARHTSQHIHLFCRLECGHGDFYGHQLSSCLDLQNVVLIT